MFGVFLYSHDIFKAQALKLIRVEIYFNRIISEGISASRLTDNVQFHEAHEPSLLRGEE